MPQTIPSIPASVPDLFAAVAALCLRAKRECSASYFALIEEMLPDAATLAVPVSDIRRMCRWRADGGHSDFAYGQIHQIARRLGDGDLPHVKS